MIYNFILDVDGVMTDGSFYYSESGKIMKKFGAHDHDGLKIIKNHFKVSFITADKRGYKITEQRIVNDMGFSLKLVTENDRYTMLKENYDFKTLIFMGDGYYDAKVLKECFFGIAPNNANEFAKNSADYITKNNAGYGAVFEACLHIKKKFIK